MNLENNFLEWLNLSKNLSPKSVTNYTGAVRTISRSLSDEFDRKINIFEINSKNDLNLIMTMIESSEKTIKQYRKGNNMYSRAMKYYEEFLNFYMKDNKEITYLEEVLDGEVHYTEGATKTIIINAYERDINARKKCLDYHGSNCKICGFNSTRVYGKEFEQKIHVHHIKPLNEIGREYKVDPIHDLIPVCPNCHMILHSRKPAFKPEEVKSFIERNK